MKRFLAMLLAICMIFALAACGAAEPAAEEKPAEAAPAEETAEAPAEETAEAPDEKPAEEAADPDAYKGKTLVIAIDEEPAGLIPQAGMPTGAVQIIAATIFPYLMDYDENGEMQNCLLESYEWRDNQTCVLHLREGVLAADGTPYTASDVIYSFKLGLEGSNAATYADLNTEEWVAEDDYTCVCKFKTDYPLFPSIFTNDYASILSESVMESLGGMEAANLNPALGGGYYNFVEWVPGQYIMLQYNEEYWNEEYVPNYEFIKLTFIADAASRGLAIQAGDADVAIDVGLSNTLAYENVDGVNVNAISEPSVSMLWLNCGSEVLQNKEVREAIGHLIDFDALNTIFTNGMGDRCRTSIPPTSPYYYQDTEMSVYDPELGLQMLKDAGYGDGFDLFLFSEPTEGFSDACELIQAYLAEANINVSIDYANQTNYFDTVQNYKYDMLLTMITGSMLNFMAAYYNNGDDAQVKCGGPNYSDEQLREYSRTICTTFDDAERADAFINIQKMDIDEFLCYGISSSTGYHLTRDGISNLHPGAATNLLIQYIK